MSEEITRERARELRMLCSPWAFQDSRCKDFKPETEQERERVMKYGQGVQAVSLLIIPRFAKLNTGGWKDERIRETAKPLS